MIRVPCADWQKMQADLAVATVRADGYALLVAEYRTALEDVRARVHVQLHGGYAVGAIPADQCYRWVCDVVNNTILAADPEARASELLARSMEGP